MKLTSPLFKHGNEIPTPFTVAGPDISPALAWSDVPDGVKEFALIMDDPDAPSPQPWVHWVIYKIPGTARELSEGIPRNPEHSGMKQGSNSWPSNNVGYRGPAPPPGHGKHHYHFKLYALDAEVNLPPRASKEQVLSAMKGHVVAEAELMGVWGR